MSTTPSDDYAEGGVVNWGDEGIPVWLTHGCDYIIPASQVKRYHELLDKLNQEDFTD